MKILHTSDSSQVMLKRLASDRPQHTHEMLPSNDFYGHADILKRYLWLEKASALKCVIEHGWRERSTNWAVELNAPFFVYLVWSPQRFEFVQRHTPRACFALGPMIEYAPPLRTERLHTLQNAYGRNLLFFPSHSTHWVDANHDTENMCDRLETMRSRFQTIRVCMYWRDIQRGLHVPYQKRGFMVQCAGHIYDRLFYNRLRELIEPATVTASMTPGSCIGHSLCLGKPYWHLDASVDFVSDHTVELNTIDRSIQERSIAKDIAEIFAPQEEHISPVQWEFSRQTFGVGQRKSAYDLRLILQIADEIWRLSQLTAINEDRVLGGMLAAKALERLHTQDVGMSVRYAEQAAATAPDLAAQVLKRLQESMSEQADAEYAARAS